MALQTAEQPQGDQQGDQPKTFGLSLKSIWLKLTRLFSKSADSVTPAKLEFTPLADPADQKQKMPYALRAGDLPLEFAKRAGFIKGTLEPVLPGEVTAIRAAFRQNIRDAIAACLPVETPQSFKRAMYSYAMALSRMREKVTVAKLAEGARMTEKELKDKVRQMLSDIHALENKVRSNIKASSEDDDHPVTALRDNFFGGTKRIYFKLHDESVSPVRPLIEQILNKNGYQIADYEGGYATNDGGKNIRKIGKVLTGLEGVPAGLLKAFQNDPCRRDTSEFMVVLTCYPADIARGSFARGWQSCRADADSAARHGAGEYKAGVIAAYLVRKDDPEIHDPLARVFLKPYDHKDDKKKTVYFTFNPIGLHFPAFADAVNRFADATFNRNKFGEFKLRDGCEHYREFSKRTRLPETPEKALQALDVPFQKIGGKLVVEGDITMRDLGLSHLPDLTGVVVKGGVDVSNNKLLSLYGLPLCRLQWLKAQNTLISSLAGMPEDVGGTVSYTGSPYLLAATGAPRARDYSYGDQYSHGKQTSSEPGCPTIQPEEFHSFKKA